MKYGIREICEVVLKAKANQRIGNKIFYKGEPVIYFDSLKTSSFEGAATTVYAQGGRGNSRLVAWEGERTVTFTMEDALISTAGLLILTGAGLVEPTDKKKINVHCTETVDKFDCIDEDGEFVGIPVNQEISTDSRANIYIFPLKNGEIFTEPYVGAIDSEDVDKKTIVLKATTAGYDPTSWDTKTVEEDTIIGDFEQADGFLVDYYTAKAAGVQQIEITPDKFGGNYYLEASTLFRDTNGVDMPAEFIIPNCKVQSNFTFALAATGDPSTFTFTLDAFPDYTMFDKSKKVLAAIQIIADDDADDILTRTATVHDPAHDAIIK